MKSRVTADQEMRQLNVKLALEDSEFLQDVLRPELGLPYNAEAARELSLGSGLGSTFRPTSSRCSSVTLRSTTSTSWRTYKWCFTNATKRSLKNGLSRRDSLRRSCNDGWDT